MLQWGWAFGKHESGDKVNRTRTAINNISIVIVHIDSRHSNCSCWGISVVGLFDVPVELPASAIEPSIRLFRRIRWCVSVRRSCFSKSQRGHRHFTIMFVSTGRTSVRYHCVVRTQCTDSGDVLLRVVGRRRLRRPKWRWLDCSVAWLFHNNNDDGDINININKNNRFHNDHSKRKYHTEEIS